MPRHNWKDDEDDWTKKKTSARMISLRPLTVRSAAARCTRFREVPAVRRVPGPRSHRPGLGRPPLWWKAGGLLGILAVLFGLLIFCF